jgi:hypothetical protein
MCLILSASFTSYDRLFEVLYIPLRIYNKIGSSVPNNKFRPEVVSFSLLLKKYASSVIAIMSHTSDVDETMPSVSDPIRFPPGTILLENC